VYNVTLKDDTITPVSLTEATQVSGTVGGAFCTPSLAYGATTAGTHELLKLAAPFDATGATPLVPSLPDAFTGASSVPLCVRVTEPSCDDWSKGGKGNRRWHDYKGSGGGSGGGKGWFSVGGGGKGFFGGKGAMPSVDGNGTWGGNDTGRALPFYKGDNSTGNGTAWP
jgi:hypothetical protein